MRWLWLLPAGLLLVWLAGLVRRRRWELARALEIVQEQNRRLMAELTMCAWCSERSGMHTDRCPVPDDVS